MGPYVPVSHFVFEYIIDFFLVFWPKPNFFSDSSNIVTKIGLGEGLDQGYDRSLARSKSPERKFTVSLNIIFSFLKLQVDYQMLEEMVICPILQLQMWTTTRPLHQFLRVAELLGVHGEIHKPLNPQIITLQVPDGKKCLK